MPDKCDSSCEAGPTSYHNPTEEISLYTVFLKIGNLEGTVIGLSNQVSAVQLEQKEMSTKLTNIATVAAQPHECLSKEKIKAVEDDIEDLQKIKNQALGGKAMLVFLLVYIISLLGIAIGLYKVYQSRQDRVVIESHKDDSTRSN